MDTLTIIIFAQAALDLVLLIVFWRRKSLLEIRKRHASSSTGWSS